MPVRGHLAAQFAPTTGPAGVRVDVSSATPLELRGPFAAARPGELSRYFLRNVTAGILDGDEYTIEVCVAPGARVHVVPTAAAKAFPASRGSRIHTRIEVFPRGELRYDGGTLIPHRGAALEQVTELVVHDGGRLAWTEVLALGRLARGERLAFDRLDSSLRLLAPDGRVRFERRSELVPARDRSDLETAIGEHGALGTALLVGYDDLAEVADLGELVGRSALPDGAGSIISALAGWPAQIEATFGALPG